MMYDQPEWDSLAKIFNSPELPDAYSHMQLNAKTLVDSLAIPTLVKQALISTLEANEQLIQQLLLREITKNP